jgi:hypothetical protein
MLNSGKIQMQIHAAETLDNENTCSDEDRMVDELMNRRIALQIATVASGYS